VQGLPQLELLTVPGFFFGTFLCVLAFNNTSALFFLLQHYMGGRVEKETSGIWAWIGLAFTSTGGFGRDMHCNGVLIHSSTSPQLGLSIDKRTDGTCVGHTIFALYMVGFFFTDIHHLYLYYFIYLACMAREEGRTRLKEGG
jgi:hypothetical protein